MFCVTLMADERTNHQAVVVRLSTQGSLQLVSLSNVRSIICKFNKHYVRRVCFVLCMQSVTHLVLKIRVRSFRPGGAKKVRLMGMHGIVNLSKLE